MLGDELELANGVERHGNGQSGHRGRGSTGQRYLLVQAGDAELEELVEVAGEDRQELRPLEERVPCVPSLVQDPRVELQP